MKNKITINHNAGFFSCCTFRLKAIIDYYNRHNVLPIVDSSNQWKLYKDENIDITEKFFKNENFEFNLNNFLFTNSLDEEQFSDYSLINFDSVNFFIKKYFTISDEVTSLKETLISKYNLNLKNILSIYYRGNDKSIETELPSYEDYLDVINFRIKNKNSDYILVQSDEKEFYDFIKSHYENVIYFDEIVKNTKGNYNNANKVEHGYKTYNAQLFLAIIKIISETNQIITNSGNVGMWITLFRGNCKNVSQFLNPKEYIYGIKNPNFKINNIKWIHN